VTVYIEDCLIENFVVTFLILKCVTKLFKSQTSKPRLWLACIFASVVACLFPLLHLPNGVMIICKILVGVLIVAIAFKNKMLASFVAFLLFTALYAGINLLVYYFAYGTLNVTDNFPTYILLAILLVTYYFITSCVKLFKKNMTINCFVYEVKIVNGGQEYFVQGFLDSGNTLLDQDSTAICIINFKVFNMLYKHISLENLLAKNYQGLTDPHYVKSKFASGGANLLVFTVDKMWIKINNQQRQFANAKLGLSYAKFGKNFGADMLLNINMFVN